MQQEKNYLFNARSLSSNLSQNNVHLSLARQKQIHLIIIIIYNYLFPLSLFNPIFSDC